MIGEEMTEVPGVNTVNVPSKTVFDPQPALEKIGIEGFKKILDAMQECVWVGDETERTIYANPNFCSLLGYELEEIIGQESYIFWDEESTKTVKNNNQLRVQGQASRYEGVLLTKTGDPIPVFLSGTPIPSGGTVGIITDLREINSLKNIEEELTKLNELKDDFISLVSHELRTPMTAIRGYISMMLEGDFGELPQQVNKVLTSCFESANRQISLINDMLDVSRIEKGKIAFAMENIAISRLIDEVDSSFPILAKDRGLHFSIQMNNCESIHVEADVNRIKQVLFNLLTNALKFTPKNGDVVLKIEEREETVYFGIIDTGIGIPQHKIDKIFDKFFQVQNQMRHSEEGIGLGLAISQSIVKGHGSTIQVKSEVGKGSEFGFELLRIRE